MDDILRDKYRLVPRPSDLKLPKTMRRAEINREVYAEIERRCDKLREEQYRVHARVLEKFGNMVLD